jgi:hypothetical protein
MVPLPLLRHRLQPQVAEEVLRSNAMDFMPPGYIQRTGDERFPRFVIRDGVGQYWAGEERRWRDKPSEAVLFHSQAAAVEERARHCLGSDPVGTFAVMVMVSCGQRRWATKTLLRFLKRHRRFFIATPAGKTGLLLEIVPDTLKKVEP